MLSRSLTAAILVISATLSLAGQRPTPEEQARMDQQNAALKTTLQSATKLPMKPAPITVQSPGTPDWAIGMVSWISAAKDGTIYLLQRGDKADPVLAIDWPAVDTLRISERDREAPTLEQLRGSGLLPTWDETRAFVAELRRRM